MLTLIHEVESIIRSQICGLLPWQSCRSQDAGHGRIEYERGPKRTNGLPTIVAHDSTTTITDACDAYLDRLVLPWPTVGKGAGDLNHAGGDAIWGQLPALQVLGSGHTGLDTLQHADGRRGGSVYSIGRVHADDGGGDVCGGCVREDRGGRSSRQKKRWTEQLACRGTHGGRGHGAQGTSSCQGKHGGPVHV